MVLVEMATVEVKGAIDDYTLGSTQPWVSSDVKSLLIDFEIAIFSSPGIEHGLSRCWTTWRAQRAPWARQLIASSSLLRNYILLNPRSWWEWQCNENCAKFVYQTPGPLLMGEPRVAQPCQGVIHINVILNNNTCMLIRSQPCPVQCAAVSTRLLEVYTWESC